MPRQFKQEPPFCIQVELALGCNLACSFCGINGIGYGKAKQPLFMDMETARAIAHNIQATGWTSRIEFARRGEPLLNPNAVDIIAVFRRHLPRTSLMMLTNGVPLVGQTREHATALFDAGLNVLAVEEYDHAPHGVGIRLGEHPPFAVYNYPEDPRGNPHTRRRHTARHLVLIKDIKSTSTGTHSVLNNHGGYGSKLRQYAQPCAKPFRELSVNYDGTVNYCCIAWGGEGVCGNAATEDITAMWNNARFNAVRRYLLHGQRTILTCKGCDHPSYRTGLLPDKKGQQREAYPTPTAATRRVIAEMEAEGHQVPPTAVYQKRRKEFEEE